MSPLAPVDLDRVRELPRYAAQTVPEDWLDEMGHMNVQFYVGLFSKAARGLFEEIGLERERVERERRGTFALRQFVEYRAEVLVGDRLSVHSRVLGRSAKRLHFIHFLVNDERDGLAATLESLSAHVDLDRRRSVPFPPEVAASIDRRLARDRALPWHAPTCGVISA